MKRRDRDAWHQKTAAPVGVLAALLMAALACARGDLPVDYAAITPIGSARPLPTSAGGPAGVEPVTASEPPSPVAPGLPTRPPRPTLDIARSPTPDAPRASALDRQTIEQYTVQRGDTLNEIGGRYGVSAQQIAEANGLDVAGTLSIGQTLFIPLPDQSAIGPGLKLLPDSEFVLGPGAAEFNIAGWVQAQGGYLASYSEAVPGALLDGSGPGETLTGSEIVRMVSARYSVSPQLLLALIEYQSGWVRNAHPDDGFKVYPLRRVEVNREGLFRQLTWTANQLNQGYYGWRAGWLVSFIFDAGGLRIIDPGLNAGSVGVQNFFAKVLTVEAWTQAVSERGFAAAYQRLFGNPFRYAVEPLVPADLLQPALQLPFEPGQTWAFTGGPHGAWDTGSAWAALDFAPPGIALGCVQSDAWVTAAAPGLIVRAEHGAVLEDLDGDGFEGTGWALFYMHLEARDRVTPGTFVNAGDRLGHPSCEGGYANGTHFHFARKYNGEWIAADGPIPFVLEGWVSAGLGQEYDGTLTKDGVRLEACDCRAAENEISR